MAVVNYTPQTFPPGFALQDGTALDAAVGTSTSDGFAAAGTNQATGTAITQTVNNMTTCAASAGVVLPVATIGRQITLFNNGTGQTCKVYGNPSDAATIDGTAGATGVSLSNNNRCTYRCVAPAKWISALLGATSS